MSDRSRPAAAPAGAPPRVWVAAASELGEVARLLSAFRDHNGSAGPSDERVAAGVERVWSDGDGEYLLAARERERPEGVAQVRFRWSVWTDSEDAWLEDLYVSESARRAGLGAALLDRAIDRARARGCARIELDVDEENRAALELYASRGFRGDVKASRRSLLLGLRLGA